jgi:hypothetical protein
MKRRYPNLRSRLLLAGLTRNQPVEPFNLPRPLEAALQWYEQAVLGVDTSDIRLDRPVFLIGLPRSGTTVLQDILCSHPGVAYIDNTMNLFPTTLCAVDHIRRRLGLNFEGERYLGDSISVTADSPNDATAWWIKWFHIDPFDLHYRELGAADLPAAEIESIHETLRRVVWCYGQPYRRLFSKVLGVVPYLPALVELFPDASLIHIVRHPGQTANSMVKLQQRDMGRQDRCKTYRRDAAGAREYYLQYPRGPRLAEYVERYGALDVRTTASLWNDHMNFVDAIKADLPHYHEVRYEDILAAPEREFTRILEFCELGPVPREHAAYWDRLAAVGKVHHVNAYGRFDEVREICREAMGRHGYDG